MLTQLCRPYKNKFVLLFGAIQSTYVINQRFYLTRDYNYTISSGFTHVQPIGYIKELPLFHFLQNYKFILYFSVALKNAAIENLQTMAYLANLGIHHSL